MKDIKRACPGRARTFLVLAILLLFGIEVSGQAKKNLSPADYERWYYSFNYALSPDGKWVNYNVHNPKGKDTLVLQKTNQAFKQITLGGTQGRFSPKSDRFAFVRDRCLIYQELKTLDRDSIQDIDNFFFSKGGMHLIAEQKKKKELKLIHLATNNIQLIKSVESYVLSPDSTKLALIQQKDGKNVLQIIKLVASERVLELALFNENIFGLTWNTKGNGVAFFELVRQPDSTTHHQVHYLTFREKQLPKILHQQSSGLLPAAYQVPYSRLFFSLDDGQLFFDVKPFDEIKSQTDSVKIWSTYAKVLPPPKEEKKNSKFLMCWHLKSNRFALVNDLEQPIAIPTSTGKYALVVDNSNYLPHFEYEGIYVDLYIKDLITGTQKLIVKKINHQKNHIVVSPHGKYITWFANANWWIYNIATDNSSCLTCPTQAHFENLEYDRPGEKFPNDRPYWIGDDKAVLLSDFYDVWLFNPDTNKSKRLTNGYASKSKFRLYESGFSKSLRDYFLTYQTQSYSLEKGILLKEVNTQTLDEGFSFYKSGKPLQRIFYTDDKVNPIYKANDTYLYVLSDFDKSPELIIQQSNQSSGKIIQHSNEHQKEFYWGKSELIHYVSNDVSLKGALFYPADYQPNLKYPMIVYIYEKMSPLLRKYVKPSFHNSTGFNVTNLTASGYFVLYPDISYSINETGKSALESVLAGIAKSIQVASIDSENIGLYGHSFGGFEVSYIIGQTSQFKTAVSGAGWHDLVDTYLDTDEADVSNIWRFDTQQLRITASFLSKEFIENSPINHVSAIKTPLLLWAGMEDYRVNWKNSVKMQIALWRLKKESTLLLYPNEQHLFTNSKNQKDLSLKILSWFNYYLKENKKPNWIK